MLIQTDYIGEVEYSEEELIVFPEGIYGFEDYTKFIIVGELTKEFPFVWLQSVEDEKVVFVLTDPFLFVEEYDFSLNEENVEKLQIAGQEDLQVFGICVIPNEIKETTLNLKSPVVINANKRQGLQVILDEDWPYKHKLFQKK
ncbi:MAG: flagellar assembly protein FliW [Bacillota bacterium]|nr:flagellar assembly protein FliW [Bacillota bacterium]